MAKREAKSPYRKYRKTPYRYSELFNQWEAAVRAGDEKARNLGRRHLAAFFPEGLERISSRSLDRALETISA